MTTNIDLRDRGARLTFAALREANAARQALIGKVDRVFGPLHFTVALMGELGEACNIIKKIERGDFTLDDKIVELADELADVQTYLDLLAQSLGINLEEATVRKWNKVSERWGAPQRLYGKGNEHYGD